MQEIISSQVIKLSDQRQIYKIGGIIGTGTFGTVFKGYDKQNGRIIALKYVQNNYSQTWRQQVKALQIFDHPNIVKYYSYVPQIKPNSDKIQGIYIVTQFIRGKTLEQYINSAEKLGEKGLSQPMVFKLFMQLLQGFDHIHSKGFVHRDIKPQNILIDENENVKIIDLGQSKQRVLLKTKAQGTPLYAAPQTLLGDNPTDFRRDVWSLGLVLYEMITGKCYFQQWKECQGQQKFKKYLSTCKIIIKYPFNFDPFWKTITKKMLKKNYNFRVNLHEIIFQLKNKQAQLQKKFASIQKKQPIQHIPQLLNYTGNTNPLVQSQNEFEFSRTKKYLKFFKNKHHLLILLINLFSKFKYPFISNSHKLILSFLLLNIYISSIEHLIKRIANNKIIITENQQFDAQQFEQPYKTAMTNLLSDYRQYYKKQSQYSKNILLQRILPKFTTQSSSKSQLSQLDLMEDHSLPKPTQPHELILQYTNIQKLIQDFKQGINYTKITYLQIYNQIIFSQDIFQNQQNIRLYFYQQDMSIYYLMIVIAHLDTIFSWSYDFLGNQIYKFQEQLHNLQKNAPQLQQFIKKINKYNHKQ